MKMMMNNIMIMDDDNNTCIRWDRLKYARITR